MQRHRCKNTTLTPPIAGSYSKWICADATAPAWGACGGDVQCGVDVHGGGGSRLDNGAGVTAAAPSASSAAATAAATAAAAGSGSAWVAVDIKSKSATEITLDLTRLNGSPPLALRYAWGDERDSCCPSNLGPTESCVPESCPIWDTVSGLPGNPFLAQIVDGHCSCIAPQVCDNGD